MDPRRREANIAAHIKSTSSRTGGDSRRLATELLHRSWPGGQSDRSVPVALDWLRRWHPARAAVPVPLCSCRTGYCHLCN